MRQVFLRTKLAAAVRRFVARRLSTKNHGTCALPDLSDPSLQRIAFLKIDGIGDFVLSTGLLNVARQRLAGRDVTLICNPLFTDLARELYPEWTVITAPRLSGLTAALNPKLWREVARLGPFDILVDLRTLRFWADSLLSSWIPARCKVAMRNQYKDSTFTYPNEPEIYHHLLDAKFSGNFPSNSCVEIHNAARMLEMLFRARQAAPSEAMPSVRLRTIESSPPWGAADLSRVLAVCPFSGEPIKEYPFGLLAEAVRNFAGPLGLKVAILGGRENLLKSRELETAIGGQVAVWNLVGQLKLAETARFLTGAAANLSVDTGLAHVSIASETPTVVILGGGHYGQFGPWGDPARVIWLTKLLPCFGCNWFCTRTQPDCIREILPVDISRALAQVSGRHN